MIPVAAARNTLAKNSLRKRSKVIAVNVSMELPRDVEPGTAFEVALRSGEISNYYLTKSRFSEAYFVIHADVGRTNWANFEKLDELIGAGEATARESSV